IKTIWRLVTEKLGDYKDTDLLEAYITENGDKFLNPDIVPENVKALYTENGGNPQFDGVYNAADRGNTVFAQVIAGMEVVDKLAQMKTDKDQMLKDPVLIKSIEITAYQKKSK
ncbi:MAG: peptidylprolyl isomerase, partial [Ruminococcus sp.]|nr:peptidylprolyl isomerase [Ruminococcus sp.]